MTTLFIDIDGTLTDKDHADHLKKTKGTCRWANPNREAIGLVKKLISRGHEIVIWSAGGRQYAIEFCDFYGIEPIACVAKPKIIVDDQVDKHLRKASILTPEQFLKKYG